MYNESLPLSNINSSLLFRLASMPITTQLYIHFTHIFSEKKSICYKVWQRCNHSSKVHFRTMCMRLQYSCTTPNRRTLKLSSFCFWKRNVVYIMGWIYTNIFSTIFCHFPYSKIVSSLLIFFFFYSLFLEFLYSLLRRITAVKTDSVSRLIWNQILWKTPAHCAVVYTTYLHTRDLI